MGIRLTKSEFSVNKLIWLGFELDKTGYATKFLKTEANKFFEPPKTLKQLRSFMGTLNHLQRFISDLHKYKISFRSSLKVCNEKSFMWEEEQNLAFMNILDLIAKIPNLYPYDASEASQRKS